MLLCRRGFGLCISLILTFALISPLKQIHAWQATNITDYKPFEDTIDEGASRILHQYPNSRFILMYAAPAGRQSSVNFRTFQVIGISAFDQDEHTRIDIFYDPAAGWSRLGIKRNQYPGPPQQKLFSWTIYHITLRSAFGRVSNHGPWRDVIIGKPYHRLRPLPDPDIWYTFEPLTQTRTQEMNVNVDTGEVVEGDIDPDNRLKNRTLSQFTAS